jgi:hypothetical protein
MSTQQDLPDGEVVVQGELVTIERYQDTLEAELAKGRLDSAGITSFLNGEEAGHLYGTGMGMLQLQVASEDEADARAIMNDPGTVGGDVTTLA